VDVLNELGAAGIEVEAGAYGVLCLSTDRDGEYAYVWSANGTGTVWEVL
jgi:hypothetical protein